MLNSVAFKIFNDIKSNEYTDTEKAAAIYIIMQMPTHNSINKDKMVDAINYLWNELYYLEEEVTGNV